MKFERDNETWIATAYHRTGAWCSAEALSENAALIRVGNEIQQRLVTDAADWVTLSYNRGSEDVPNCSEGAIRLPIDLWVCKLFDKTCPIQARVFLNHPEIFFQGCLASAEKKQQIFDTAARREYRGFHHLAGRIPCFLCEDEGKGKLSYYYPWELADLEDYSPFIVTRDWPTLRPRLPAEYRNLSIVTAPLCASHAKVFVSYLDLTLAEKLVVLEFEFLRP